MRKKGSITAISSINIYDVVAAFSGGIALENFTAESPECKAALTLDPIGGKVGALSSMMPSI